jgi:hypothetical protein
MSTQVYLSGADEPLWITEAADLFVARVQGAAASQLLAVTRICAHDEGEDPSYEERTGYVRADQVAYVAPLGPKAREHLTAAREATE